MKKLSCDVANKEFHDLSAALSWIGKELPDTLVIIELKKEEDGSDE